MTGRGHQHAVAVGHPLVAASAAGVGLRVVVGVGVAAVLAGALLDVEHGIELAALDVHPDRAHRLDPPRLGRRLGDEVDLVDHVDLRRHRREVVDHVVEVPGVRRLVLVAVTLGNAHDRLLLAGGEEELGEWRGGRAPAEIRPHSVVEVDHVHTGDLSVGVGQVGPDAGDPAIHRGLLGDDPVADLVLTGDDVERADPVGHPLGPVGAARHRHRRLRRAGRRGQDEGDQDSDERASRAAKSKRHRLILVAFCGGPATFSTLLRPRPLGARAAAP